MAEPYDLRSNIKGKPGSQGTLFQVTDKGLLNPQQRWPRGYTPERSREVEVATRALPISYPEHMENAHEPGDYQAQGRYRPHLLDVIKRSTVPVEHLQGLRDIHGTPEQGHDATYWPMKRTIGIDMNSVNDQDRSLIHELGHHHDMNIEPGPGLEHVNRVAMEHAVRDKSPHHVTPTMSGVTMAANKVREGVGEAVADNYMTEHYRSPGKIANQQKASQGQYEKNFTRDRLDQKYPGYTDVRPSSYEHMGPQFAQEHLEGMDQHWVQNERNRAWFGR